MPRRRTLSPEQESAIGTLALTRSLRSLAVKFDVSHETVRVALHEKEPQVG